MLLYFNSFKSSKKLWNFNIVKEFNFKWIALCIIRFLTGTLCIFTGPSSRTYQYNSTVSALSTDAVLKPGSGTVLAVYIHFRFHGRKCVSYSRRVAFSHHHIMAALAVVDVIIPSETVKFTTLKFSTQTSGPCGYSQTRIYTHLSSSGSQTAMAMACLIYNCVVRRQSNYVSQRRVYIRFAGLLPTAVEQKVPSPCISRG